MSNKIWFLMALLSGLCIPTKEVRAGVVINEIMYNPSSPTDTDEWDFIELFNSDVAPVGLDGWCLDGIGYCFPSGAIIEAGGYMVVARNAAAFQAHYGMAADGEFTGALSNGGERLALRNALSAIVDEVNYSDAPPWPPTADSMGPGIERIVPTLSGDTPRNWRVCTAPAGHTARALNSVNAAALPPYITTPAHTQNVQPAQPIQVSADVVDATAVDLVYRIGFAAEVTLAMFDDGLHNDGANGDGRWGAEIPGQPVNTLVRYRIVATGPTGEFRHPRIDDSIIYDGTVVEDVSLVTQLPVFQWFVDPVDFQHALDHYLTDDLEPAVFYYGGKLYDNIRFRVRGQTSRSFPKKHWKFDMPRGHDFVQPDLTPIALDQFNLQSDYSDKAFVREILAYETLRDAGSPSNVCFHVRLHQNGAFFGLYSFTQAMDDDYLTINNIDENGAWYKSFDDVRLRTLAQLPAEYEKDTRLYEGYEDVLALVTGINTLSGTARRNFLFDNVNIAEVINYIAVNCIIHNNDHLQKNFYLYRDTEGTGRWTMHPWDMDLTFGRNFGAGSAAVLSDGIWADNDEIAGRPLVSPSHPLFGDTEHQKYDFIQNKFIDVMHETPELRSMYYRRLRTLIDQFLATNYYENRIDELTARVAPEAALDVLRPWGQYGTPQTLTQAANLIKLDYLPRRRTHLLTTHRIPGEIPVAQYPNSKVVINEIMYRPTAGDTEEFVELYNPSSWESVDISQWRLDGVALNIPAGTVVLPLGYVLFAKSDVTFRSVHGPGKFVAAEYSGSLNDAGEQLVLLNREGVEVDVVDFESVAPWPAGANGGGFSLELIDASRDNNRAGNWAQSLVTGGTPGAANSTAGSTPVLPLVHVNEVLTSNNGVLLDESNEADPWIELYNSSADTIDLSGMYVTNNYAVPITWQFPQDTYVCGQQWLVLWADSDTGQGPLHANFTLSPAGGSLGLYTTTGNLVDYLNYPPAASGVSFGKFPDGGSLKRSLPRATANGANSLGVSSLVLNEYNGVSSTRFLKDNGSDSHFGRIVGNGGDWFELVVTHDHLDIRGWQLEIRDNVGNPGATLDTLTFSQDQLWSDLRSGTIITVAEDVAEDVSYHPSSGDWWINVRANNGAGGAYITADNFPVSNDNWQIKILDDEANVVFGPAGEGVQPVSGIGNDEVCKLEEDPTQFISAQSDYNDGTSSTFGSPNVFGGGTQSQSFDAIRDVFEICTVVSECDDGNPCTTDDCVNGECAHTPFGPCYELSARLPDAQGAGPILVARTGDVVRVAIDISGVVQPINGVQFILTYDPARLQYESVISGDGQGSPWDSAVSVYSEVDSVNGTFTHSVVLIAQSSSADSTVCVATFSVIDDGSDPEPTQIDFSFGCIPQVNKLTSSSNEVVLPNVAGTAPIFTGAYPTLSLDETDCSQCIQASQSAEVLLKVSDLYEPINGIQALLRYDPNVMGSPTVLAGDGAGSPWDGAIVTPMENPAGELTLGIILFGSSSAVDSTVARLSFPIVGSGETQLEFRSGLAPYYTKIISATDNSTVYPFEESAAPIHVGGAAKVDMNGDGQRDGADIQRFVEVLLSQIDATPAERCAADTNFDGDVTVAGDLAPFVDCLLADLCPCS